MSTVTIDRAGRIVVPKGIRDQMHLSAGDTMEISVEGDDVKLRLRRSRNPMRKKQGVWVFDSGEPMTYDEAAAALRDARERRDRKNAGEAP